MTYLDSQFQEAFKRLDNLCKDVLRSDRGVSSYIEAMEQMRDGSRLVRSWNSDHQILKRLRHIRNSIAHDNYPLSASESDLIDARDMYARIMDQTDPISLAYKARQARVVRTAPAPRQMQYPQPPAGSYWTGTNTGSSNTVRKRKKLSPNAVFWLILLALALIVLITYIVVRFV